MAKKNGTLIVMRQGATHGLTQTTIVGQTDATMNTTADMLDSTTKDNAAKAKSFAPGETGWTFSISGLYDPAATTEGSVSNAITDLKAGTAWVASWGEDVTDEMKEAWQKAKKLLKFMAPKLKISHMLKTKGWKDEQIENLLGPLEDPK